MAANSRPQLGPLDLEDCDFDEYLERFDIYVETWDIPTTKKVVTFLQEVGPEAYKLIRSLCLPDKPASKSFDALVEILRSQLVPRTSAIVARFRFHSYRQQEGQTISAYIAELKRLSRHCQFQQLDEHLRDRLVCGLSSDRIQRRLLQEGDSLTWQRAHDLAIAAETASSDVQALSGPGDSPHQVGAVSAGADRGWRAQLAPPRVGIQQPRGKAGGVGQRQHGREQTQRLQGNRPAARGNIDQRGCFRCGAEHSGFECPHQQATCFKCGKRGHIRRACRSRLVHCLEDREPTEDEGELRASSPNLVQSVNGVVGKRPPLHATVFIGKQPLTMEVDTGASVSLVSETQWRLLSPGTRLHHCNQRLATYTGESLPVLGMANVMVQYGAQTAQLPLIVVQGSGPTLLGRNWLGPEGLVLDWPKLLNVHAIKQHDSLEKVLHDHKEVFGDDMGCITDVKVSLSLKEGSVPKRAKCRVVPYAMKGKVEDALNSMQERSVIEPVTYSEWASPIVCVPKPDGSVRVCGDFKGTVNPQLNIDQYPLPCPQDLFATLANGDKFTKLDMSRCFEQLELDDASKDLTVITTVKGLMRYNRVPYGIASAPALCQYTMESILAGIPGCVVFVDDILLTAKDDSQHLERLAAVLGRLQARGCRLNRAKCSFMMEEVVYLGHRVSRAGIRPTSEKVEAVQATPVPTSAPQLASFMGLVQYYGKFVPALADTAAPLFALLKKGAEWKWTAVEDHAFNHIKQMLTEAPVLTHYNVDMPLRLDCDASGQALGVVLSHETASGENPIAYASRTLTDVERRYSQLDREALCLVWGVKHFSKYLFGREFVLQTDCKPLQGIFGDRVEIPQMASARWQRWAVFLAQYRYQLKVRRTQDHKNADALSRMPTGVVSAPPVPLLFLDAEGPILLSEDVAAETRRDSELAGLLSAVKAGLWPEESMGPFQALKGHLHTQGDCIMWGSRVIIPRVLQAKVLRELHRTHLGSTKMKQLGRRYVWWPGFDAAVENLTRGCEQCVEKRAAPPTAPVMSWPNTGEPWQRLHGDFATIEGHTVFLVVDSYSKWIEASPMAHTGAHKTARELRGMFARFGLPHEFVSDNGPPFQSREFVEFLRSNAVKPVRVAPYHPASNGQAERAVRIIKNGMKATRTSGDTFSDRLLRVLAMYRTTPLADGRTPAELLLGRRSRTRLDLLTPSDQTVTRRHHQSLLADSQLPRHQEGDLVWARSFSGPKWRKGRVVTQSGPVSYQVDVGTTELWHRHVNQLLRAAADSSQLGGNPNPAEMLEDVQIPPLSAGTSRLPDCSNSMIPAESQPEMRQPVRDTVSPRVPASPIIAPRRSERLRRAPTRYGFD